jgi:hypothetical protein
VKRYLPCPRTPVAGAPLGSSSVSRETQLPAGAAAYSKPDGCRAGRSLGELRSASISKDLAPLSVLAAGVLHVKHRGLTPLVHGQNAVDAARGAASRASRKSAPQAGGNDCRAKCGMFHVKQFTPCAADSNYSQRRSGDAAGCLHTQIQRVGLNERSQPVESNRDRRGSHRLSSPDPVFKQLEFALASTNRKPPLPLRASPANADVSRRPFENWQIGRLPAHHHHDCGPFSEDPLPHPLPREPLKVDTRTTPAPGHLATDADGPLTAIRVTLGPLPACLRPRLVDTHSGARPEPWGIVRLPIDTVRRGFESLRADV